MRALGRILAVYGKIELTVAMLTFTVALILVIAQVLARQAGASFWWAQELAQLLVMYAYFLGMSHLYQVRQMVVVDFLVKRFSPAFRLLVYLATQIGVILFCLIILYGVVKVYRLEMRFPSFAIQIPRFYWTLPLAIASASMILTSVYFVILALRPSSRPAASETLSAFEDRVAFARVSHEY
jgi:TRAP-type C4-dicarboxylate transport system permease small subunit